MDVIRRLGDRVQREHNQFLRDSQRIEDRSGTAENGPAGTSSPGGSIDFENLVGRANGATVKADTVIESWDDDVWNSIFTNAPDVSELIDVLPLCIQRALIFIGAKSANSSYSLTVASSSSIFTCFTEISGTLATGRETIPNTFQHHTHTTGIAFDTIFGEYQLPHATFATPRRLWQSSALSATNTKAKLQYSAAHYSSNTCFITYGSHDAFPSCPANRWWNIFPAVGIGNLSSVLCKPACYGELTFSVKACATALECD